MQHRSLMMVRVATPWTSRAWRHTRRCLWRSHVALRLPAWAHVLRTLHRPALKGGRWIPQVTARHRAVTPGHALAARISPGSHGQTRPSSRPPVPYVGRAAWPGRRRGSQVLRLLAMLIMRRTAPLGGPQLRSRRCASRLRPIMVSARLRGQLGCTRQKRSGRSQRTAEHVGLAELSNVDCVAHECLSFASQRLQQ